MSDPFRSHPPFIDQEPRDADARRDKGIRAGDERAFESLFVQHYTALCAFTNGILRSPDDAEEVVQTVFHRLWQARSSWNPRGGSRAYLFAACRNQAINVLEHEQVVWRHAAGVAEAEDGRIESSADAWVEAADLAERLRTAVAALPERRRQVVTLRLQYHLSNGEIARCMGISIKAVEVQFARAVADLRRRLKGAKVLGLM
jgi:RNA polymerase sigma-70 factor (ECF subfamily)